MTAPPIPPRAGQIEEWRPRINLDLCHAEIESRWVEAFKHETKEEN